MNAYYEVCATNAHAAGDGDTSVWHDNFAYEHNQREMHKWARRITDLKNLLSTVRVIEIPASPATVQIGCFVLLRDEDEGGEWSIEIAGYEDGDAGRGRVSYTAPLARKIIGGGTGDAYELFLDGRERTVVIAAITPVNEKKEET